MAIKEIYVTKKKQYLTGSVEILLATLMWGYGFIVIRNSLDSIALGILMIWRYVIAFVILLPLCLKFPEVMQKKLMIRGAVLGALLYISQYFQTKALAYTDTTAGKVAFITALYIVMVPFLNWLTSKRKPDRLCLMSACVAIPGLFLLTMGGESGIGTGDMLAFCGSLGFSVHILAIDRFTKHSDILPLTILQFGFAAVCSVLVWVASDRPVSGYIWNPATIWPLAYLGIFSTMLGFFFQMSGQKHLPPEICAVLLSTESVFGMLFSALFLGERLGAGGKTGCLLMFVSVLMAERGNKEGKTR